MILSFFLTFFFPQTTALTGYILAKPIKSAVGFAPKKTVGHTLCSPTGGDPVKTAVLQFDVQDKNTSSQSKSITSIESLSALPTLEWTSTTQSVTRRKTALEYCAA